METQKMSDYHTALHLVHKATKDDPETSDALQQMETHNKSLHDLLRELVDTGSLNQPSGIAIDILQELGLIGASQSSHNHIQFLTELLTHLSQPTTPPIFFDQFHNIIPRVVAHDRSATTLADKTRLFTLGLLDPYDLTVAYTTYVEETRGITQ